MKNKQYELYVERKKKHKWNTHKFLDSFATPEEAIDGFNEYDGILPNRSAHIIDNETGDIVWKIDMDGEWYERALIDMMEKGYWRKYD